jgi:hypothetical protein
MTEWINKDLFGAIWLGLWMLALLYSLFTFGYQVWFKPEEFIRLIEERRKNTPRWLRFFMVSMTSQQSLWMARFIYLFICLMILLFFLIVLVLS